jgi:hypothetical protein
VLDGGAGGAGGAGFSLIIDSMGSIRLTGWTVVDSGTGLSIPANDFVF